MKREMYQMEGNEDQGLRSKCRGIMSQLVKQILCNRVMDVC